MNKSIGRLARGLGITLLAILSACNSSSSHDPKISSVATDPNPPVAPRIRFTLVGTGFDPNSVRAFFRGPGCPDPCEVPANAIDTRTETKISGLADLGGGTYEITTRNGDGPLSNTTSITLIPPPAKR